MKKLLIVAVALAAFLFINTVNAQDSILVTTTTVPVGPQIVTPYILGARVYQPYAIAVEPRVDVEVRIVRPYPYVIPPPQKPIFATPIRDGIYYGTYYNRVWRFNRLGRLLNAQPVPGQVNPEPTPVPVPTNPNPGPVTPNDP